jgi:hypothetical protein
VSRVRQGDEGQVSTDVREWLDDTYTAEGVRIWLAAWTRADENKRKHMERMARTPDMGT